MRVVAVVAALALVPATARADADEPPASASGTSSPPDADRDPVATEMARQAEQIRALRVDLDAEKHAREHPTVRLSGFLQIDWIARDQASANEINDSNGTLLNQDRFTLRRGHCGRTPTKARSRARSRSTRTRRTDPRCVRSTRRCRSRGPSAPTSPFLPSWRRRG